MARLTQLVQCLMLIISIIAATNGFYQRPTNKNKCVKKTKYFGCYYFKEYDRCFCTTRWECENPFPFENQPQCKAFYTSQKGACKRFPCVNQGKCTPTTKNQYQCDCRGTGFYGNKCHKLCPRKSLLRMEWLQQFLTRPTWKNTPLACAV